MATDSQNAIITEFEADELGGWHENGGSDQLATGSWARERCKCLCIKEILDNLLVPLKAVTHNLLEDDFTTKTVPENEIWYESVDGDCLIDCGIEPREIVYGPSGGKIVWESLEDIQTGLDAIWTFVDHIASGYRTIKALILPEGLLKIGSGAFSDLSSLERIHLPNTLTTIETVAFENCTSLEHITIPANVTYIGNRAFDTCISLKTVTFNSSTITGDNPATWFAWCESLETINVAGTVYTASNGHITFVMNGVTCNTQLQ